MYKVHLPPPPLLLQHEGHEGHTYKIKNTSNMEMQFPLHLQLSMDCRALHKKSTFLKLTFHIQTTIVWVVVNVATRPFVW